MDCRHDYDYLSSYVVRPGTIDYGKEYESLMVAYVSLVITNDSSINDFFISSNDKDFGNFDDVVLESETTEMKYALQLKHNRAGKPFESNSLTGCKGEFSIIKYFDEFKKIKDFIKPFKLILLTNRPSNMTKGKIVHLQNRNISIKIMEDKLAYFDTGICYRFKIAPNQKQTSETKQLETFFKQFYLCTNQPNNNELEKIILNKFQEIYSCKDSVSGEKYIKFILEWCKNDAKKKKLDRKFLEEVITICLLTPDIKPFSFAPHEENKKHILMRTAISTFNVTLVDEKYFNQIECLWSSCLNSFENDVKTMSIAQQYHLTKLDVLDNKIKSIILWLMEICPLIVTESKSTYKAICLNPKKTFIILGNISDLKKEQHLSCFYNLTHLRKKNNLYEDFLKTFHCSLEGKAKISLQDLFQQSEEFNTLITTSELLQMLDDSFTIGKKEILPEPHIERYLKKNIIQHEFLNNVKENTQIIISCDGNFDKIKHYLTSIDYIDMIKDCESIFVRSTEKTLSCTLKRSIYLYENRCSRGMFEIHCTSTWFKKDTCHHFRVTTSGLLEWMYSKGGISDLRDYKCTSISHCCYMEENELVDYETYNDVNIVTADPGMGKSVLLKSMKNHYTPNYWVLLIDTKDHSSYFEKKICDSNHFVDYIIEKTQKQHLSNFEFEILNVLKRNRRITFLWDGLDEIFDNELNVITQIIDNLSKKGFKHWITSRTHMQNTLEQCFKVISIIMRPFDDKEREIYIEKRLTGLADDLKDMVINIQNYVDLVENNAIFGIPLQIWMLTELFIRDNVTYQELLKNRFSISDLYQHFVNQKFTVFFEQRVEISTTNKFSKKLLETRKKELFLCHEQLALKTTFDSSTLSELNIHHSTLSEEEQDIVDIGIITEFKEDDKPTFAHLSYAEYFTAIFLYKKCIVTKQEEFVNKLKFIIFHQKYRNIRFMFDLLIAGNRPAHLAVLYKNFESLKNCTQLHIRSKDNGGRTPLHLICSWGRQYPLLETEQDQNVFTVNINIIIRDKEESPGFIKMLQFLLENGCNPADEDELFQLDMKNYADRSLCLYPIIYLLNKQFRIDFNNFQNFNDTCTVLVYSAQFNFDFVLDVINAPLIFTRPEKMAILHIAAANGSINYIEKLFRNKKQKLMITWRSEDGITPIYLASRFGYKEIVELLIAANEDNDFESEKLLMTLPIHIRDELLKSKTTNILDVATTDDGMMPIHATCWFTGCYEVTKLLAEKKVNLNSTNKDGFAPIHLACDAGYLNIVELLTKFEADLAIIYKNGYNSIHMASKQGHYNIVKFLIEQNIAVNTCAIDGVTPLLLAAEYGHYNTVKLLISSGADINITDEYDRTPIFAACVNGRHDVVKLLIEFKADININEKNGNTPLRAVCQYGFTEIAKLLLAEIDCHVNTVVKPDGSTPLHLASLFGHFEIAEMLIKSGANPNVGNELNVTPLYCACQQGYYEVVKLLIASGADIEMAACDGCSPIFSACEHGHYEIVKLLIDSKADIERKNNRNTTPIYFACQDGHLEIAKLLVNNGANVNTVNEPGNHPLHIACAKGYFEIVKFLVECANSEINVITKRGATPLRLACQNGHYEIVRLLLEFNANPNIPDDNEDLTPVFVAFLNGHSDLVKLLIKHKATLPSGDCLLHTACQKGDYKMVAVLIELKSDNAPNNVTPIQIACENGHYEIVKLLIESGADLNWVDQNGNGPLHHACTYTSELVKLLILETKNVDVNAINENGVAPIHFASYQGNFETVKILIESNAKLDVIAQSEGKTPIYLACEKGHKEVVKLLIESGANLGISSKKGLFPIHAACRFGHYEIVKMLIEANYESRANINHLNNHGNSPIHTASAYGHYQIVKLLISHEGVVNTIDQDGDTPLHDACCNGHLEIVLILIQHGARIDIQNKDGSTPLDLAVKNGHTDIVNFLLQNSTGPSL